MKGEKGGEKNTFGLIAATNSSLFNFWNGAFALTFSWKRRCEFVANKHHRPEPRFLSLSFIFIPISKLPFRKFSPFMSEPQRCWFTIDSSLGKRLNSFPFSTSKVWSCEYWVIYLCTQSSLVELSAVVQVRFRVASTRTLAFKWTENFQKVLSECNFWDLERFLTFKGWSRVRKSLI